MPRNLRFNSNITDEKNGPEEHIKQRYSRLCRALTFLALDSKQPGAVRVSAHRVIQEYIIKPIKEELREQKKLRAQQQSSLPGSISVAVANLPVGTTALITTQQPAPQTHANQPYVIDVANKGLADIELKAMNAAGPPLGEAPERLPDGFIDTPLSAENSLSTNKGSTKLPQSEYDCDQGSKTASRQSGRNSSVRKTSGQPSREPVAENQQNNSESSCGGTSSNSQARIIKGVCGNQQCAAEFEAKWTPIPRKYCDLCQRNKNRVVCQPKPCEHCGEPMTREQFPLKRMSWGNLKMHKHCRRKVTNEACKMKSRAKAAQARKAREILGIPEKVDVIRLYGNRKGGVESLLNGSATSAENPSMKSPESSPENST